jgi:colicin import membrane protein
MLQVIRENPRAFAYAVIMHLVLLVLLVVGLDWTPKIDRPGSDQPIQAQLVTEVPAAKPIPAPQQPEPPKPAEPDRAEQEKAQAEAEAKQRAAAEAKQQAEQQAKEKAVLAEKKKAEALAKKKAEEKKQAEAEAKQKAAAEAKKKAEAEAKKKADAEAKKKAEAEAKQKAAEAQRKAEAELQAQLAAEQQQARAESALAQYIPYIQDKVNRNWIRPPGSPEGLVCVVHVTLIPGGQVVGANVIQSSGDPLFDRSVESAVLKASPLPLPPDPELFNNFREINFKFNPGR